MESMKSPTMLSIKEVAERTKLPTYTIRRLIEMKKVAFINNGRKYYVNYEQLVEYLNNIHSA